MGFARWSVSLVAIIGLFAATIAGAIVWLILTDPVTVAESVSSGDVGAVVQAIGAVIYDALQGCSSISSRTDWYDGTYRYDRSKERAIAGQLLWLANQRS